MRILVLVAVLLGLLGCTRNWPVPVRSSTRGRIELPAGTQGECRLVADALETQAELESTLGPELPRIVARLGLPAGTAVQLPADERAAAAKSVAWNRDLALLVVAGPCEPGLTVERVVQPGAGPLRWELRIGVDAQVPSPPALTWLLIGATRGEVPPMRIAETKGHRLTPGSERLTFAVVPDVGGSR